VNWYIYDKKTGELSPVTTWRASAFLSDPANKIIEQTQLPNCWVSTVFLGLDHGFSDGAPLVFETMVFPSKDDLHELDCERYSTLAEAKAGHARLIEKYHALMVLSKAGVSCEHCETLYPSNKTNCPNCGAPRKWSDK
jgi:hypothetical protein